MIKISNLMNKSLQQDYGILKSKFKYNQFEVKFYTSAQRDCVNPFSAQFPFLINRIDNNYHLSVSPKIELDNLESDLVKHNSTVELMELDFNFLREMFDCKLLYVNRYFMSSNITESTNDHFFNSLTDIEIENLSKVCKIPELSLTKLNSEHKIYLNHRADKILGYGFITRQFDKIVEISVATVKSEREKGVGLATASRMTDKILKQGKSIIYIAEVANIASNKIALKCGFEIFSIEIVGYKERKKTDTILELL